MEIISFSKASKVFQDIKQLNETVVGEGAEGQFNSVDERLDWIEAQASNLQVKEIYEVDLNKGQFNDAEFKDGSIQLRQIGPQAFVGSGVWESEVIDLGSGMQKILDVKIQRNY
ncbi:hypothetical protein [Bacillus sp. G3(2015)]|jgi:hypothetical protein|uniref:hypothetical protein n=1 Tax=Bacillus TaxID=1386 RepID=UPI000738974A|nr:hypothetical protein [Bacillus sp. G3(2015)]MBS9805814.1 hypothetical protein [Bacillus toyonensis]MDA1953185.1 hypothetical protein [Bacillus cereus]KUF34460.1 hypothetical protein AMR94_02375 [Bacillus sp. G3(2015)]MEB9378708.1 hypothetical protein [Bacillus cereus]HDX9713489.1 hypothetical protein [Bacillus cereus]